MKDRLYRIVQALALAGIVAAGTASPVLGDQHAGHSGIVMQVAFSPDGSAVASVGSDNVLDIWDAQTGALKAQWRASGSLHRMAYSPDGAYLAADVTIGSFTQNTVHTEIDLLDPGAATVLRTLPIAPPGHGGHCTFIWSPDSKTIAAAGPDGPAALWDVATGTVRTQLPTESQSVAGMLYSGDGKSVDLYFRPPMHRPGTTFVAPISPLAFDVSTGAPVPLAGLPTPPAPVSGLPCMGEGPHGRCMLVIIDHKTPGDLHSPIASITPVFWDANTGAVARSARFDGELWNPVWAPDGSRVAFVHGSDIQIVDATTGAAANPLNLAASALTFAVSPVDARLAIGKTDGTVAVYSAAANAPVGGAAATFPNPVWIAHGS